MSKQVKVSSKLDLLGRAGIFNLRTVEKTANYTVLNTDGGTVFIANHATVVVNFTLPAVGTNNKGHGWIFCNRGAAGMGVIGGTAGTDKMVIKNDASADSVVYTTSNEKIGAACACFSDGTNYFFMELGTSTQTTAT